MGMLSKLVKGGVAAKILKKTSPVAKKVLGGKKTGGMGQKTASALNTMGKMRTGGPTPAVRAGAKPPMRTGGPAPATKIKNAQRMSDFARPRGKRPAY